MLKAFQSLLFVPGSRPERFAKALASGADIVVIDLEDAVGPADKESARASALAAMGDTRLGIRVNGVRTRHGLADLWAIGDATIPPPFVMVPMVESAAELEIVHAAFGPQVALLPLIETVRGLRQADAVARAPGVAGIMLGGADFAGELGVEMSWDALYAARAQIVMACASARIASVDVPYLDLDNLDGLATDVARVKAMGFTAKSVVHPKHVPVVHQVMRPTADEVTEAHEAEAVYAAAGEAAVRHNGKMLEAPVMARYRRILELEKLNA
ncbi:L-malyl-CoA/beta-methylmalyl-CoA lyase [Sphingomonas antarctica]|uniref:HpcH/HpaI aldolase/citrate lyase family protein n=1 Tax=Sphingomonas antarctica TaxID=2040274 RepID=UPI0039E819C8